MYGALNDVFRDLVQHESTGNNFVLIERNVAFGLRYLPLETLVSHPNDMFPREINIDSIHVSHVSEGRSLKHM